MKKFITKNIYYVIPIVILHLFAKKFYAKYSQGDLFRLSYIMNRLDYRNTFEKEYENDIHFDILVGNKTPLKKKYTVFNIGDSFSRQGEVNYHNYLTKDYDISVLNFNADKNLENPIQDLYNLVNGDFFDYHQVEYVILQSVERRFVRRALHLDTTKITPYNTLKKTISDLEKNDKKHAALIVNKDKLKFPSERVVRIPYSSGKYHLKREGLYNNVYIAKTKEELFSIKEKECLFFIYDVNMVDLNNNSSYISNLNNILNKLSFKLKKKGIKLIVLPCPDKYDIYYEYIENKNHFSKKPLFFDLLKPLPKDYIYIDAKEVLNKHIEKTKDLYYYGDSHWSPWAAKIIAREIDAIIKKN